MRIDCAIYKEMDEIDHLTIRYRRGQGLDRVTAIDMIKRYTGCFADVSEAFQEKDLSLAALQAAEDQRLHEMLWVIRTVLGKRVFEQE